MWFIEDWKSLLCFFILKLLFDEMETKKYFKFVEKIEEGR